ncbi:methionyl-tRNA formyltransferase [Acidocella aminolytica]|uniref:Methionyl-tRNA formyltransferase n=1 Tax=Acidocella aminolytica 101 = DSM 11237 TaxID=1120923 RepID=A0A0D6PHW0_9PROT|nr:methionyl-tRNA formyltransferase [Acidocella aminolytica]GAN80788.1 methionyl-tRNA formyl transferase [Acidocella aminolytica 101 = DSM 11237]GBQ36439.1 methionyl-tRNA formyl transferase [Acidocella aminolytica 101 = DSM 11237]SHE33472.1 methionyl-tRNA formyltransferase [Acidocella aminolytica 101 = DSM 11237]
MAAPLKLAFMGSPGFAVFPLKALVAAGHEVMAVYAQPSKPAGRGQKEQPCPVHAAALELGLPVRTPVKLRKNQEELDYFRNLKLDAAVVAAYGLILPQEFLDAPERGCLNIHGSLLPRWRGAAPIQAAIAAGDAQTGITIMQMEAGLDTGPMLRKDTTPIGPADTSADLHDRLAEMGARLIIEELAQPSPPQAQDEALANYAPKLSREDARLDVRLPAVALERRIRAFSPWPGALGLLGDVVVKIISAEAVEGEGIPGTLLPGGLTIACGEGALRVTRLQRAGKAAMSTEDFLRGYKLPEGARFY